MKTLNNLRQEISEAKKMKGEDPCWTGYKMLGTKAKGGKQVPNCIPEEIDLDEGSFKYHMNKAIAANERGDDKKEAYHLDNARSAKFAMKTADYAKNRELLDKHKQMSKEVVAEESEAYEKAQENKKSADDAKNQGDMFAHHMHMSDHHENLSQWHYEKGRSNVADSHAKKSEEHHEKAIEMKDKQSMAEEVEPIDEISTDGYYTAAAKSRMNAAVKVASSMGQDKQAKTKLDARNRGMKRVEKRTQDDMKKANSGPQRPRPEKKISDAEARGYGQGRYMGDSYEPSNSSQIYEKNKDVGEYDYEGDMAKIQLRSLITNAQQIHDMLEDNTNMAEWVQSKITLAADYISTVSDYMQGEVKEEVEPIEEASTTTVQRSDTNRPTYDVHSKATGNRIGTIYTPSKTNPKHQTTVYDSTGKIHKRGEHDTLKDAHDFIKTSRNIKEDVELIDEADQTSLKMHTAGYDVMHKETGNKLGTVYQPTASRSSHVAVVHGPKGGPERKEFSSSKDAHNHIKQTYGLKEDAGQTDESRHSFYINSKNRKNPAVALARKQRRNLRKPPMVRGKNVNLENVSEALSARDRLTMAMNREKAKREAHEKASEARENANKLAQQTAAPQQKIKEGIASLISKNIKKVTATKPTPQQKADIRLNK